jgi:predicted ester cyclase
MLAGFVAALPDRTFQLEDLVAEGDDVVARYSGEMSDTNGNVISFRGLTYDRLAEGRIVEADPITTPDVAQELGNLIPAQPA